MQPAKRFSGSSFRGIACLSLLLLNRPGQRKVWRIMATTKKQTKEQTKPKLLPETEPKYGKDTPESICDILNTYADLIFEAINRPDRKPADPKIFYDTRIQLLYTLRRSTKKDLDITLPGLPELAGTDYTRGLIDLSDWIESAKETVNGGGDISENAKEAYIPYSEAIKLSNGILNRRKLDAAIKDRKVRSEKPNKQRRNVHIQDVLALIEKPSTDEDAQEKASKMFGEYREATIPKMQQGINLD